MICLKKFRTYLILIPVNDKIIAFWSLVVSVIAALSGGLAWYAASITKRITLERTLGHIKGNQEVMSSYLTNLEDKIDDLEKRVGELIMLLIGQNKVDR